MNGRFLFGFVVGLLTGILGTVLAIFGWFVPVRSTTSSGALDVPVVEIESIADVPVLDVVQVR